MFEMASKSRMMLKTLTTLLRDKSELLGAA